MPKKSQINLLPQEEFEASVLGRALKWAMSTFRIIVIVTEMIVMGAFLSRFWLDAKNSDLAELITLESSFITAQIDTETQFRDLQKKLSIFKIINSAKKPSEKIDSITSKLPQDVYLTSISVQDESAQVRGVAGSDIGIAQFIANLKAENKSFKGAEIGSLSSSEENPSLTLFTVRITF